MSKSAAFSGYPAWLGILACSLSGCITQSLHVGRGRVIDWQGQEREAALYWHSSAGRLWYGKKWEGRRQNFVTLRYGCSALAPVYAERAARGLVLEASSTGTDFLTAQENADGSIDRLPARVAADPDRTVCGRVRGHDLIKQIEAGENIAITVLCEKCRSEDPGCTAWAHYPKAGRYTMGPITIQQRRRWSIPSADSPFADAPEAPSVPCNK